MAQEDFDTERLAAYLHMMPADVTRLAERGKLPGRRIGGEWRFSAAEIHHWLENRIGLSDDEALVQMEGALDRATDAASTKELSIAELLRPEAIEIPLRARTRGSVITAMTDVAARTHLLWDPAKMAEAVRAREEMHSTALDNGVALLHPRRPMPAILAEAILALGITPTGIPFGSDGNLTDIFFLLCSTSDHEHLRILARLSRIINDADFLRAVRAADSAAALHRLVSDREAAIRNSH
jgi:PTS system nitrogen regulatory IIA component